MVWIGFIPLVCRSLRVSRKKIRDVWYRKQKNSYSLAGSKYKLNTLFKRRNRWNRGTIEEYGKMEGIRDNSMPCGYTPIYGFEAMFGKYLPNDSISSELEKTNCQDELAQKGKWEHKGQLYAKTAHVTPSHWRAIDSDIGECILQYKRKAPNQRSEQ